MIMLFEQEEAVKRYGNRRAAEARIAAFAEMVEDNTLTIEQAANKLGMTVEELKKAVEALKVTA